MRSTTGSRTRRTASTQPAALLVDTPPGLKSGSGRSLFPAKGGEEMEVGDNVETWISKRESARRPRCCCGGVCAAGADPGRDPVRDHRRRDRALPNGELH